MVSIFRNKPNSCWRFAILTLGLLTVAGSICSRPSRATAAKASQPQLRQHIGQMVMVGFRGTKLPADHWLRESLQRYNLGGVLLFDKDLQQPGPRNITSPNQLRRLTKALQAAAPQRLLIAVDQEGGQVARLGPENGFPATVSHTYLGQLGQPSQTYHHSRQLAATLARAGINLNLAPVVDLCVNPDNPIIAAYQRCFSPAPATVTRHASEFIRAHQAKGVLTCAKHFPGHGSSASDSHAGFTDITHSWSSQELEPYRHLIAADQLKAIMTAHVVNRRLDPKYPATLSRPILQGLLRQQLGFAGVILSDDMQMAAIRDNYSLQTALYQGLEAGVDMFVFGNNLVYEPDVAAQAVKIIRRLVIEGSISAERIEASYTRIQAFKAQLQP